MRHSAPMGWIQVVSGNFGPVEVNTLSLCKMMLRENAKIHLTNPYLSLPRISSSEMVTAGNCILYILYLFSCWPVVVGENGFKKTHHIAMTNATSLFCRNTSCRSRLESASLCSSRGNDCRATWFKRDLGGPQCGLCMCDTDPTMGSDITGVLPDLYAKSLGNLTLGMYQGQRMSTEHQYCAAKHLSSWKHAFNIPWF